MLTDLIKPEHIRKALEVPFTEQGETIRAQRIMGIWQEFLKCAEIDSNEAAAIGTTLSVIDQAIEIALEEMGKK